MALISLRSRSRVRVSMVLTRADHLLYTQLYKITSEYYMYTYVIDSDEAPTILVSDSSAN